ncbi:UNVERIFIED_CONTAM: hypothetical protein PYX00_009593 [Menopon gallinae]|uniref:Protein quiver n=1 Tax=Menopon gallinae TaxID=328185 RepID=A0AAW2HBX5_9NEOP
MSGVGLDNSCTLIFAALILQSVKYVISLSCYQCTIRPPPSPNQTARLCSQFDYSKKYIVDCPFSTLCMKKTFRLPLQKDEFVEISVRDCAPQKYTRQVYEQGMWRLKESIQNDVYTVGCKNTDNVDGLKVNSEQYCFCDSSLCNSGQSTKDSSTHSDIMTVIFIFNALKYIRSIA